MFGRFLFICLYLFLKTYCECSCYGYDTFFYKQKVDHFAYSNDEYFFQRYLISDKYWDHAGGPIFFYTGNEGDITVFANNTGFMWEIAPKYHALLVFAEHRYYGTSLPYGSKSFDNRTTWGHLTTEQALADFASLIYHIKETLPGAGNSKVIAFGGSYGGMLAAWLRMKYPHMVAGAIASSAPVLQFSTLTPCSKFSEIVTNDFYQASSQCSASIKRSWKVIRNLGKTETGVQWLALNFKICNKFKASDIDQLIIWLKETWEYMAMTNYPYPTEFLMPLPGYPINEACKHLKNASEPDKALLLNILKAASIFQNYTGTVSCFNISSSTGPSLGTNAWDYQSCTEMIMPMCQNGVTDMFEPSVWDFESFAKECEKKFHVQPEAQKALIMYGGRNITAASNIVFSNGKLDPWSAGGVLKSLSANLVALVMEGAAHHLDLRSSNTADPKSVVRVRQMEKKLIFEWLSN